MLAYLVRHAESLANTGEDRGLNSPLSPLGERQVAALVGRLAATSWSAIYSSPYRRCLQTAQPIAAAVGLPVRIRPELCEYHHFEPGTPGDPALPDIAALVNRHPGVIPCPDYNGPYEWAPVDETFESVIRRTRALAAYLKQRWTGPRDTVLLVSHGSPVARIIEAWLTDQPGPWFRFTIDNAAVSAVRYYDGVSGLVCLNETSHLRGLPAPRQANYADDGTLRAIPGMGYW